ncbi:MAG: hypothetical protein AAFR52_01475 [Pseudomonadota bacterium]
MTIATGFLLPALQRGQPDAAETLRARLDDAQTGVVTGRVPDPAAALDGQTGEALAIEHDLATLDTSLEAGRSAAADLALAAQTLDAAQGLVDDFLSRLTSVTEAGERTQLPATAVLSGALIDDLAGLLDTARAGRHLFSRDATATPPFGDDGAAALKAFAEQPRFADPAAVAPAFDGGGEAGDFVLSDIYAGGNGTAPALPARNGYDPAPDIGADGPAFDALFSAVVEIHTLLVNVTPETTEETVDALSTASVRLREAVPGLVGVTAEIGAAEARLSETNVAAETSRLELEGRLDALIGVDEYEAASELAAAERTLSVLYATQARILALSFADYLR